MAKHIENDSNVLRGERFKIVCGILFPGRSRCDIGKELNHVSGTTIRNWEKGYPLPLDAVSRLEEMGASVPFLLRGEGEPLATIPDGSDHSLAGSGPNIKVDARRLAKVIGANLRHLRAERFPGWGGQKKFAEFLGITPNDLCVFEHGRQVPNRHKLSELSTKLDLGAEGLLNPLPGVKMPVAASPRVSPPSVQTKILSDHRVGELEQALARSEGKNEALAEQIRQQQQQIRELQEINSQLKGIIYSEDAPEAKLWRKRLFEQLNPSISELLANREAF